MIDVFELSMSDREISLVRATALKLLAYFARQAGDDGDTLLAQVSDLELVSNDDEGLIDTILAEEIGG